MSNGNPKPYQSSLRAWSRGRPRGQRLTGPEIRRQLTQLLKGVRQELADGEGIPSGAGVTLTPALLEAELTAALAVFEPLDAAQAALERARVVIAESRADQLLLLGHLHAALPGWLGARNPALRSFGLSVAKPRRKLGSLAGALKAERQRKTRAENDARRPRRKRR